MRPRLWLPLALIVLAAVVRLPFLTRQGLWVDEIFSLAMSTGHSLEHPAAQADPEQGDFIQGAEARGADEWRAYLRHDPEPAGPRRVLRAVLLSDTSPPLYYLALWGWTRVTGTSDLALRSLSLVLCLASFPFLLALARRTGGRGAVLPAGLFFALAPPAIYFGTEGRMYALLWLCVLAFAWVVLRLRTRPEARLQIALVASSLAGLHTHYFFLFVWAPLLAWLLWRPGRAGRARIVALVAITAVGCLPWYSRLPASLAAWRITGEWLTWEPFAFHRASAALELLLGYLTGGARDLWGEHGQARTLSLSLFALLPLAWGLKTRARGFAGGPLVLSIWLAGALAGPLLFDLLRGTYTVAVPRYALAGLPAAALLCAAFLARLPRAWRATFLALALLSWLPNLERMFVRSSRAWCPLREVARGLDAHDGPDHVVLVHSIPSGVLGIARYYRGQARIAAWVEQLGERRVPESLSALEQGSTMLHLVRIHEVGAPAPVEEHLRTQAELVWEGQRESARISHYRLPDPTRR